MKRTVLVLILLSLCLWLPAAGNKFFASAGASLLLPADSRYADFYGGLQLCPEVRLGYNLYRNFHLWLGGGMAFASGILPELADEVKATQTLLAVGAGWETRRSRRLQADLAAAFLMAGLREQGMDETLSHWAPGFDVRVGLRYFLNARTFLGITAGYAGAWTAAGPAGSQTDVVLGGLRLGALIGIRF